MLLSFHSLIADKFNLPPDLIKTVIVLLLSILMAPIFHSISNPKIRYLYSLVPGILFTFYIVQIWGFYVLAAALLPFLCIKIAKNYALIISFGTSFFFLLFIHIYRYMFDYMSWKIDCSVTIMYLITKVTYYGYWITKNKQQPSLIPYLSYCYFFPSITVGPAINYEVFQDFIAHPSNKISNFTYIFKSLLKTILLIGITIFAIKFFTAYWVLENEYYLALPFYLQFLALNFIGFFYRIKFYGAWGFVQLAIDLSGISWNQKTGKYDRVQTGSILFETELNPKFKTEFWNTSVQIWIKEVIFTTLQQKLKSSTLSLVLTFLVSAFWHGIYLTYYIGFIQWAMIIIITKWAYKCSQILPELSKVLWMRILSFIVASSLLNYTGMFMVVLTWNQAIAFCSNMKFIGHFLMVLLVVISFTLKPSFFKKLNKTS